MLIDTVKSKGAARIRNFSAFATLLSLNVRFPDFATFLTSQPRMTSQRFPDFATSAYSAKVKKKLRSHPWLGSQERCDSRRPQKQLLPLCPMLTLPNANKIFINSWEPIGATL